LIHPSNLPKISWANGLARNKNVIMGLLSINNKIQKKLADGESRAGIFHELSQTSPSESGKFAYCINSIPTEELRKKYLVVNALLIISLVGYSVLTLLSESPINFNEPTLFIFMLQGY
jgi:hypothetical protein